MSTRKSKLNSLSSPNLSMRAKPLFLFQPVYFSLSHTMSPNLTFCCITSAVDISYHFSNLLLPVNLNDNHIWYSSIPVPSLEPAPRNKIPIQFALLVILYQNNKTEILLFLFSGEGLVAFSPALIVLFHGRRKDQFMMRLGRGNSNAETLLRLYYCVAYK